MQRFPAAPFVVPFAVFIALLAALPHAGLPPTADLWLRLALPALALAVFSRPLPADWRPASVAGSAAVGIGVFLIWIAPDLVIPGYRDHWLFQNRLTGSLASSLPSIAQDDPHALALRFARAVLLVPIVEELFWRGWLMRWIIRPDFRSVPLGAYTAASFWGVAALFALEHGPYWDVGLLAGAVYNWWMVSKKRLSDLVLAHAVTNACLSMYVLFTGRWEYWL